MKPTVKGWVAALVVAAIALVLPDSSQYPFLAGLLWLTIGMYLGMAMMDNERQVGIQLLGLPTQSGTCSTAPS